MGESTATPAARCYRCGQLALPSHQCTPPEVVDGVARIGDRWHRVAEPGRRICAFAIDLVLLPVLAFVAGLAVAVVWLVSIRMNTEPVPVDPDSGAMMLLAITVTVPQALTLLLLVLCNCLGTSPGKWFMGIRVTYPSGRAPGIGAGLVRSLFAPVVLATLGCVYFTQLLNPKRQAVHDAVSGTLVVHKSRLILRSAGRTQ